MPTSLRPLYTQQQQQETKERKKNDKKAFVAIKTVQFVFEIAAKSQQQQREQQSQRLNMYEIDVAAPKHKPAQPLQQQ